MRTQSPQHFFLLLFASLAWLCALGAPSATAATANLVGFTQTQGGRGGALIRVTTLAAEGTGSLRAALETKGPRIIVFEVGGVIDLAGHSLTLREPNVTIAGQTAPSPGITLIRGGLNIGSHDVIISHLRIRAGDNSQPKKSGWEVDSMSANGSHDVIVDHCSCTWSTDENLSASGPRFEGADEAAWREHTSHRITFSNCIIAEGLSNSSHSKGEHSKGSLIHDNTADIAIFGNLYANNMQRNPLFKGGARGVFVNNYIVNPGELAVSFGLVPTEWEGHPWTTAQVALAGNYMQAGHDTKKDLAFFTYHKTGAVDLYMYDNVNLGPTSQPAPQLKLGRGDTKTAAPECHSVKQPPLWPAGLVVMPSANVPAYVLANAGARPWDRDAIDKRILEQARTNSGRIIDSQTQAGGYPAPTPTHTPFDPAAWNLETMQRAGQ